MRRNLQHGDTPVMLGMAGKQMLVSEKSLRQALAVIKAVNTQEKASAAKAGQNAPPRLIPHLFGRLAEAVGIDRDRKARGLEAAAEHFDVLAVQHSAARLEHDVIEEGAQIPGRLKTNQVTVTERRHELAVVGQRCKDLGRWKRRVQEKTDRVFHSSLAQL